MKRIVLKSIRLENWASRNCKVVFGNRTKIMGENKVGKSSIMFAWRWLLTSRIDAVHPANYELFDKNVPLSPDTPMAIVEAVIDIDGCEYVLTRKAEASFKRERGKSEWIKSPSDKYYTYIDNIEYTATQFGEWLETNIAPLDMLPFCIDGVFFSTLCEEDKKKGRKVLERIVGEITEMDFKGNYSMIIEDLKKLPIEKIIERTKSELSSLKERSEKIPVELEVKENLLSSWQSEIVDSESIESAKKRIDKLDKQIIELSNTEERNKILQEIHSIELSLSEQRNTHEYQQNARIGQIKGQIREVLERNANVERANNSLKIAREEKESTLRSCGTQLNGLRKERELLLNRRDEVKGRTFVAEKCTYCGQDLPVEMVDDLRTKFNEQKEKELTAIITQGKAVAERIKDCESQMKALEEPLSMPLLLHTPESTEELEKELAQVQKDFIPFESTNEYINANCEIQRLRASLPDTSNVDRLIIEKQEALQDFEKLLKKSALIDKINVLQKEIDALYDEQRKVGIESAMKESVIAKCNEWVEERANIISDRINGKLNGCEIQMYSVQKNGEKVPDCVMVDASGVPYGRTNTGEKMNMDIELQKLFMRYFDIELPIFIDECSRFNPNNVPNMEQQHILIFATDDKALNVIVE